MRLYIVSAVYGIWLAGIEVMFYIAHAGDEGMSRLELVVVLGAVPAVLQAFLLGFDPAGLASSARTALVFLLIAVLSYLVNGTGSPAPTFVGELVYLFMLGMLVAGCRDRRLLRTTAAMFSLVSGLFLTYVDMTGEYHFGRLESGLQPNLWGLMGLATAVTALAYRSVPMASLCIGMGLFTMYAASSRSSMVGFVVTATVIALLHVRELKSRRFMVVFGGTAVALALAVVLAPYLRNIVPAVLEDVLKLDDPYRGLGQGFTGRDQIWQATVDLWLNSPVFGLGFRQHEQYLLFGISAHNAYLAMLADTGIFGLIWYVVFLVGSGRAAFQIPDRRTRDLAVAVIISYAVIGFFERRAINGGNPMSILFLMLCFHAMAQRDIRKATAPAAAQRLEPGIAGEALPG
jgi:O-antigen ligase